MKVNITVRTAASALPSAMRILGAVAALSSTRTAPVGESMPVASGGNDVVSAIQRPPMQLPISIAQIPMGMPPLNSPGNISAANETMLAISTTEATRPAMEFPNAVRPTAMVRDQSCAISADHLLASQLLASALLATHLLTSACDRSPTRLTERHRSNG